MKPLFVTAVIGSALVAGGVFMAGDFSLAAVVRVQKPSHSTLG